MAKHKITKEDSKATQFKKGDKRAVECGRKGREALTRNINIEKRRREMFAKMATMEATEKNADNVRRMLNIEDDDIITNDDVISASVFKAAVAGDAKAREEYYRITASTQKEEFKEYHLPAIALGKAFVDINRLIVPNKSYVFEGGRGSLKSSYVSLKIVELLKNNPTSHVCIVRQVANTLKDSVYAQMQWAISYLNLDDEFEPKKSPLEIIYKPTGQIIYFRGADEPTKLKSIKPPFGYIGILWKEEKDQLKGAEAERSINQSVLRGNGTAFYDLSSYNPPKTKDSWVNKELLVPNPNRIVHHSTYMEAPAEWLGEMFLQEAEHLKEVNPSAYEHEYLGVPNGTGGNVFENVEVREITDEEISHFDNIYQGADFGWFPDPFAFVRMYYDKDRETIYIFDELYVNKWANAKTAEWIINKGYDDFRIICDSAEPKSVNDFRDAGLPARGAIKGPGSIDYGFKWLQARKIVVDAKRCPNTTNELLTYEYERDKEGNPISGYPDGNDHAISAIRYGMEPVFNKRGYSA